jgi:DNA polymerase-3 subunit delta'
MIYPWQAAQWSQIQQQFAAHRLPHALLLTGAEGLGKLDFARALAAYILCKSKPQQPSACGQCDACRLITAGTHPDYHFLAPEDVNKAIKVDDIRALCESFTLTSQFSGYRVAVIACADNMNNNAANSLLKTLEEPGENSLLILVSTRPHRFPITIRSRCQTISFAVPEKEVALQWLAEQPSADSEAALRLTLAHGSPLLAQKLAEEEVLTQRQGLMTALISVASNQAVIEPSELLASMPGERLLGWLYDWLKDLVTLQQCGPSASLVNVDYQQQLQQFSSNSRLQDLYELLDQVVQLRRLQSIPLNSQLLWEDLLISWGRLIKRA